VDDPQFYYFNSASSNDFVPAFGGVDPTPLALTTTKSNTKLAQAMVVALNAMKASGEYNSILTKWHVKAVASFTINPPAK
jgi:ABC-type amino acid transport substrate-binding protein